MESELEGGGNRIGYPQMHQLLRNECDLVVPIEAIRVIIEEFDPVGEQSPTSRRLRRGEYRDKGVNYITIFGKCRSAAMQITYLDKPAQAFVSTSWHVIFIYLFFIYLFIYLFIHLFIVR